MIRSCSLLFLFCATYTCSFTQTAIAIQDFENSLAVPAWNYTASGGSVSTVNTGTPANARIRNGSSSFQSANLASVLTFDPVVISAYTNVKLVVHLSSISVTSSNGADAADHVRLFTALNGNVFLSNTATNADISVNGNSNARWTYMDSG